MGPRIREDTEVEVGWVPAPCLHGGRLYAGKGDGDGYASANTEGEVGWIPRLPGARNDMRERGMGPRIREDTEGEVGWIPAPVFTGAGSTREEQVRVSAR